MRVLSRYILKEVLIFFFISVLTFTGLLLTLRMLHFSSLIINKGVNITQIGWVFLAIIPTFLEIAIPLASLLGVMLAFSRLSGDSEIIVLRASGVSLYQFLKPVAIFAVLVLCISLTVSLVLRPWGFTELSHSLFEIAKSKSTSGLNQGVFNKLGDITLYSDKIDYYSGNLERVLVDDKRPDLARRIVTAQRGRIESDENAQSITLRLEDGTAHEIVSGKYFMTRFNTNSIIIDPGKLFREEASKDGPPAREMSTSTLKSAVGAYKTALKTFSTAEEEKPEVIPNPEFPELTDMTNSTMSKRYRKMKLELGQRLSMPCASLIMAFIGLALGITNPRTQRTWGAGLSASLGLLVFVIYYGVLSMGIALAESGNLKPWIAVWLPNITAAFISAYLLKMLCSERWHSITDAIVANRIFTLFKRKRSA